MMTGFAIGAGGIGVTLLGVVEDHFGVHTALTKSLAVLPVVAVILSTMLKFTPEHNA
jgi:FSR family fosmidomycin resistance protein-like MFS transporter